MSISGVGWYVEVDVPGASVPVTPDVIDDDVSRNPTANGFPRLDIPVRKRDLWQSIDLENNDVPIRVWNDGVRQPIDSLETVAEGEGATQILRGRGSNEARERVRKTVSVDRVSNVVDELVSNNTSYSANVDQPPTTVETQTVATGDTETEWSDAFAEDDIYSPIIAESGLSSASDGEGGTLAQTAFYQEAEDASNFDVGAFVTSEPNASQAEAVELEALGQHIETGFSLDEPYTIPEANVQAALRMRYPNSPDDSEITDVPALEVTINGNEVGQTTLAISNTSPDYFWTELDNWSSGDLSGGGNTLRVEVDSATSNNQTVHVDCFVALDSRWHDTSSFDNTTDTDDALSTPTLYPTGASGQPTPVRPFDDTERVRAVVGGEISVVVDDLSGITKLGLSNDLGQNWNDSGAGATSHSASFADFGATLRWRVGFQGVGSRTGTTPTQGFETPELDSWTLNADLEDIPLIVNQSWDASLDTILSDIAESFGDFIYEYRTDQNGDWTVEWTQPGLRTSDRDEQVTRYESERTVEELVGEVVIKGGAVTETGDPVSADHGTAVSLANDELVAGTETVSDGTDTVYVAGADYELDPLDGEITTLANGDITDGQSLEVDYQFHPKNRWASPTAPAGARTITRTLSQLTTSRACGQVARLIGRELDEELREGRIVIPSDTAGWDIVSAIDFDVLPFDGDIEIRDVQNTPDQTVLLVGSRQTVGEVFGQVRSRLNALSDRA